MLSQLLTDVQKLGPRPVLQPECQQSDSADLGVPNAQQTAPEPRAPPAHVHESSAFLDLTL